jgi:hypothetical protein
MKPQSRYIIHYGINFIIIPVPAISHQTSLRFQQAIISHGLDFVRVENLKNQITIIRDSPSPLHLTVGALESQVGQFLIVAPNPKSSVELFIQEAEAAVAAYAEVWPAPNRQILKCDATLRELHETTSEHAFQELWERRLGQSPQSLKVFGKPIRGGGLRFVMDPLPNESEPVQIEIKIESFLRDTTKLFVESQFIWPKPTQPGIEFNVQERFSMMNSYIEKQVYDFIKGEFI